MSLGMSFLTFPLAKCNAGKGKETSKRRDSHNRYLLCVVFSRTDAAESRWRQFQEPIPSDTFQVFEGNLENGEVAASSQVREGSQ
jgi:hypothetical protein